MDRITVEELKQMFLNAAELIEMREPYLTEIDEAIGDGDHGFGVKRGFSAVKTLLENRDWHSVRELLHAVSVELVKSMGGASGVIFGTMFFGGLEDVAEGDTITLKEFGAYLLAGERAIEKRGKARPGQKTMLDALYPACAAYQEALTYSEESREVLRAAWEGARQGARDSEKLLPGTGRSRNFAEKAVGLPDPGAETTSYIFEGFYQGVR